LVFKYDFVDELKDTFFSMIIFPTTSILRNLIYKKSNLIILFTLTRNKIKSIKKYSQKV